MAHMWVSSFENTRSGYPKLLHRSRSTNLGYKKHCGSWYFLWVVVTRIAEVHVLLPGAPSHDFQEVFKPKSQCHSSLRSMLPRKGPNFSTRHSISIGLCIRCLSTYRPRTILRLPLNHGRALEDLIASFCLWACSRSEIIGGVWF